MEMVATRNILLFLLCVTVVSPILLYSYPSAEQELVQDVTAFETPKVLKEPIGNAHSDDTTGIKKLSHDSHFGESREHSSGRVLSATNEGENPIKLVTDGIKQGNQSNHLEKTDATGDSVSVNAEDAIDVDDSDGNLASETTANKQEQKTRESSSKVKRKAHVLSEPNNQNDKKPSDARVRLLKDQLIQAKVILSLPAVRNNPHLTRELRLRVKEVLRTVGEASQDSDLPRNANERMKAMEQSLTKGRQMQDDCAGAVKKLRAMLHSTEEQLHNILATGVVVNSTVAHAEDASKHVFHIVTDRLNYAAMRMWFLANPPGKATIQVQNVEEFTWLNSSYSPVLKQLSSPSMIDFYFKTQQATSDSNLKFRNPKYLSILNHLRFYLPEIFPKLNKVLFLDDDIVVQKDLTALWSVDLKGNVNGAVETCGESFHRFDRYLNFSNPLIAKNFDPHACGWAYGMNVFDLVEWKRQNITEVYHNWQKLNHDRQLWKLGTLPPGLITFYKRTFPLNRTWHVLGLGYNPNVNQKMIAGAAVVHYNGNMKPWLEISIPKFRGYWTKYVDYDGVYLRECNINP
ncbi:hypothetical protein PIB30_007491 [Stylosanthes scabra]|uniref:Hexosyltransferase n=1 Tax=Stylosanthes scabra TaxID=79078 RepID=A0ABU6S452_9FABA|nr:hypothetical protein [Stylosanthes scabra]